jgi:F-box/leucine-rich repeat protein 2/20
VTDAAVIALAERCPRLRSVDFEGCVELTDAAVTTLTEQCPELESARFSRCTKLTQAALGLGVVVSD